MSYDIKDLAESIDELLLHNYIRVIRFRPLIL